MYEPYSLLKRLKAEGVYYRLYRHAPVGCGDNAYLFPKFEGETLKNLVLTTKKKQLVLFTLPLNAKADLKAVADGLKLTRFSFAKTSDLCFLGVPPLQKFTNP